MLAAKPSAVKIPPLGDVLRAFALPALAEAADEDERAENARRMVDELVAVGRATGAEVKIDRGGEDG